MFNEGNTSFVIPGVNRSDSERLTLEPEWFDTTVEPATFEEVVAMLRKLRGTGGIPGSAGYLEVDALLARCPGPVDRPWSLPIPWGPENPDYRAGGPTRVFAATCVRVAFRNGINGEGSKDSFSWTHHGNNSDIVSYQVL